MGNCIKSKKREQLAQTSSPKLSSFPYSSLSSNLQVRFRSFKIVLTSSDRTLKSILIDGSLSDFSFQSEAHFDEELGFIAPTSNEFTLKQGEIGQLVIKLSNSVSKKEIGASRITFQSILEGPIKQNFPILLDNQRKGRIKFIAEVLEETNVTVTLKELQCAFDKPVPGKWTAEFSVVSAEKFKSKSTKSQNEPNWILDKKPPKITFPVTIAAVRDTNIKIKVRKFHEAESLKYGELWIHLPLLFYEKNSERSYMKSFNEIILRQGKRIGTVNGIFEVVNLPPVSQLASGVNTETGLSLSSPSIIRPKKTFGSSLPAEMKKIIGLTMSVTKPIPSDEKSKYSLNYKNAVLNRRKNIDSLCSLLEEKHHEVNIVFLYSDLSDLLKAQNVLMDLAVFLLDNVDHLSNAEENALAFRCLYNVFRRGELDLSFLSAKDPAKLDVCLRFRTVFYMGLQLALNRMKFKGVDDFTIKYVDYMLAVSWIRVPQFREIMIQNLKQKSYEDIPEDFSYHLDLREDPNILPTIDWENLFHEHLPEPEFSLEFLKNSIWQNKLAERSIAYFEFISDWVDLLVNLMPASFIWESIPGYPVLVKTYMLEMIGRNVKGYPESMIEAGSKLLLNHDLLNAFIRILFCKTNVYDYESVHACYEVLNRWFFSVSSITANIHYTFDWDFLINGLIITLDSELGLNVISGLIFVYNQYHHIRGANRKKLVLKFILKKKFFSFIHHWSGQVREIFIKLIMYRIFSISFLNFEKPDEWQELDEYLSQTFNLALDQALDMNTSPYHLLAANEYSNVYKKYCEWKSLLPPDLIKDTPYQYGAFKEFPYPKIEFSPLIDDFEKFAETWS